MSFHRAGFRQAAAAVSLCLLAVAGPADARRRFDDPLIFRSRATAPTNQPRQRPPLVVKSPSQPEMTGSAMITSTPTIIYRGFNAGAPVDSVTRVAVSDPTVPFTDALRIRRGVSASRNFSAAVIWDTTAPVAAGDLLLATYWIRKTSPGAPVSADLAFRSSASGSTPSLATNAPVESTTWRKFSVPFYAIEASPSGQAQFAVRFGMRVDEFEIGGVSVENFGPLARPFPAGLTQRFAFYYPGRDNPNAAWKVAARQSIARHRNGAAMLRIHDAGGGVIAPTSLTLRQVKAAFDWSAALKANHVICVVGGSPACKPTTTGRTATATDIANYKNAITAKFNATGFINDLKWPFWEDDSATPLAAMSWLEANGVPTTRGHNLIWPGFTPASVLPPDINASASATYISDRIDGHFTSILGTLNGRIREWDVVNEPYDKHDIQGRIAAAGLAAIPGVLPYTEIADWFALARLRDSGASLYINDYNIFETVVDERRQFNAALIDFIAANGASVDGVGFQTHFGQSAPDFIDMQNSVDLYASRVSEMAITEYDTTVLDEELEADILEDTMLFAYGRPEFTGMMLWGFWDANQGKANGPLYRDDWSEKPALARWDSMRAATTGITPTLAITRSGPVLVQAPAGLYELTTVVAGKTCVYAVTISGGQILKPDLAVC